MDIPDPPTTWASSTERDRRSSVHDCDCGEHASGGSIA